MFDAPDDSNRCPRWGRAIPIATLLIGLVAATTAAAQLPQSRLQSLYPPGAAWGTSVEVTLNGTDLEDVNRLWFDHAGLRADHIEGTRFRVAVEPGTPLGHHDVRVFGRFGLSNPRTFVVARGIERLEAEPNSTPEQAEAIPLNTIVNGRILEGTDVDQFVFEAKPGRTILIEVEADRIDSRLDAVVRVYDPNGRLMVESFGDEGLDPVVRLPILEAGRYRIALTDSIYDGSVDHTYRLRVHDGPYVEAIRPRLAHLGETREFTLFGHNLGADRAAEVTLDGQPLEQILVTRSISWRMKPDPWSPGRTHLAPWESLRRGWEIRVTTDREASNPLFVAWARDPIVLEREPNEDGAEAQEIRLPVDISGAFQNPDDIDVYRFEAAKGQTYWIEASSQELGAQGDPAVTIQQVRDDGSVRNVANLDDTRQSGAGIVFDDSSFDARGKWTVPDDGRYRVVVRDLYGSRRGDVRLAYRLNIRLPRPDFQVLLMPADSENRPSALNIRRGGRTLATLLVQWLDGFAGPIRIVPRRLPPGVHADPVVIRPDQTRAGIAFEADERATTGAFGIELEAVAVLEGRSSTTVNTWDYTAGLSPADPTIRHDVLAAGMVWPSTGRNRPATARVERGGVLGVLEEVDPLRLTVTPSRSTIVQGEPAQFDATLQRRVGFKAPVQVGIVPIFLPPKQKFNAVQIAVEADQAALPWPQAANLQPGLYTLAFQANGEHQYTKDPEGKDKKKVTLNVPSNTVLLTIRPRPLRFANISVTKQNPLTLTPGSSADLTVQVERLDGFEGPVTLQLDAPEEAKLTAEPIALTPDQTEATIVIHAGNDAPPGEIDAITLHARFERDGEPLRIARTLRLTVLDHEKE